jgi:hypothetical protein
MLKVLCLEFFFFFISFKSRNYYMTILIFLKLDT